MDPATDPQRTAISYCVIHDMPCSGGERRYQVPRRLPSGAVCEECGAAAHDLVMIAAKAEGVPLRDHHPRVIVCAIHWRVYKSRLDAVKAANASFAAIA